MNWRFWRSENRSTDFTQDAIERALTLARGQNPDAGQHAAAQFAASLLGRALATADVGGAPSAAGAVGPELLDSIGRSLILRGESIYDIRIERGRLRLAPAIYHDCQGGPDPASWVYTLSLAAPDGEILIRRRPQAIVHCRYATDPARPWRGQGPLAAANMSADLAASVESQLAAEIGNAKLAHILPVPFGDQQLTNFRTNLADARGGLVTAPTQASGWGSGQANAPRADFGQKRLGPEPPDSLVNLRDPAAMAILAACGISPGLLSDDGPASREAYRQLLHSVIEPLADLVAAELSAKLERQVTIRPRQIGAIDIQSRARAFRALSQGDQGLPADRAAALCGFST